MQINIFTTFDGNIVYTRAGDADRVAFGLNMLVNITNVRLVLKKRWQTSNYQREIFVKKNVRKLRIIFLEKIHIWFNRFFLCFNFVGYDSEKKKVKCLKNELQNAHKVFSICRGLSDTSSAVPNDVKNPLSSTNKQRRSRKEKKPDVVQVVTASV